MKFVDNYTIVSDVEGSECFFTRSVDGNRLIMGVDDPEGYYIGVTYLEGDLTPEKFEEYFYFEALLKYKRQKSNSDANLI